MKIVHMTVMCTDQRWLAKKGVVTTNQIYGCEDLEDAASVYDELEENHYDDLNEQQVCADVLSNEAEECEQDDKPELPSPRERVYLEVLGDETEECGQDNEPPSPTSIGEYQDQSQDRDYEGLNEEKPDHLYLHVLNDKTEGRGEDTEADDHVQEQGTTHQDKDKCSAV